MAFEYRITDTPANAIAGIAAYGPTLTNSLDIPIWQALSQAALVMLSQVPYQTTATGVILRISGYWDGNVVRSQIHLDNAILDRNKNPIQIL